MRAAFTITAVTIALLGVALTPPALAGGPSSRQIGQAAAHAERSSSLWATINMCSARGSGTGGEMGVRGQMPSLGFAATLRMTVGLRYWSEKQERFVAIRGSRAVANLSLGSRSAGLQQAGILFGFDSSAGLLSASVDFTWSRGGRVIAQATRVTTAGHHDADYGRPAHYSAGNCRLG